MRGLRRLTAMDLRLYLREPIATFFTLAFPPLLVVLFGTIYGNDPTPMFGGRGSMDVSMPAYTALILGTVAFLGIPINISSNRETGVLRRYRAAGAARTRIRPCRRDHQPRHDGVGHALADRGRQAALPRAL